MFVMAVEMIIYCFYIWNFESLLISIKPSFTLRDVEYIQFDTRDVASNTPIFMRDSLFHATSRMLLPVLRLS